MDFATDSTPLLLLSPQPKSGQRRRSRERTTSRDERNHSKSRTRKGKWKISRSQAQDEGSSGSDEEREAADFPKEGTEFLCHIAKTALILPFKWASPTEAIIEKWIEAILSRSIVDQDGNLVPLWETNDRLPRSIGDLDPSFRQSFGWVEPDDVSQTPKKDVCRRLNISPVGLEAIFPATCLVGYSKAHNPNRKDTTKAQKDKSSHHSSDSNESEFDHSNFPSDKQVHDQLQTPVIDGRLYQPALIPRVEMSVFPLGAATLTIFIDWKTNSDTPVTLQQVRTWLSLAKFRHKVKDVFKGWMLDSRGSRVHPDKAASLQRYFGPSMFKSLYLSKTTSLANIANWLVSLPQDDSSRIPPRISNSSKSLHHTLIVVNKQIEITRLEDFLFLLRRASHLPTTCSSQVYREALNSLLTTKNSDHVLRMKSNRYIGLSREGIVSLSWPTERVIERDFELTNWHQKFYGIYLMLATHVQGEQAILLELSALSAKAGSMLKHVVMEDVSLDQINLLRRSLFATATLMTRYTLKMGNDNCGGLTEYIEFFSSLREIFRIRDQRKELREEIQDVLALVEQSYMEEERKAAQMGRIVKEKEKKLETLKRQRKIDADKRYGTIVGAVSSLSIPPILVAGLLGMNLSDVPEWLPFWGVVGITLGASALLFLCFWLLLPAPPVSSEEQELEREIHDKSQSLDEDNVGWQFQPDRFWGSHKVKVEAVV